MLQSTFYSSCAISDLDVFEPCGGRRLSPGGSKELAYCVQDFRGVMVERML